MEISDDPKTKTAENNSETLPETPPDPIKSQHEHTEVEDVTNEAKEKALAVDESLEVVEKPEFTVDNFSHENITPQAIEEVSKMFYEIFASEWPEYLVCPDCDPKIDEGVRVSAQEFFNMKKQTVPIDMLTSVTDFPDCPHCNNPLEFFYSLDVIRKAFESKLSKDGWLSILRDGQTDDPIGFVYAYERSVKEVFDKEWRDFYPFADLPEHRNPKRSFKTFQEKVNQAATENFAVSLEEDTKILCMNCIAIKRGYRGMNGMYELAKGFAKVIPKDKLQLYLLGEVMKDKLAYLLYQNAGAAFIEGVYDEKKEKKSDQPKGDEYVIVLTRTQNFYNAFAL